MKTEQLIQAMAADTERTRGVEPLLPGALLLSAAAMGLLYLASMGVRPDLGYALRELPVIVKHVFPVLLTAGGIATVLRLSRPGSTPGQALWLLAAAPALVLLMVALEALTLPGALWVPAFWGTSLAVCLTFVPLLSLPVAAISMWILRRGAPTRPALTGAVAGLTSGSAVLSIYAFYCIDDSPFFYGVWYVVALGIVTLASALIGARILRW